MKGTNDVIASLNGLLTKELSAVDQYLVQSVMLADWGYERLHARIAHEADDERGHVKALVERILFLEGTPNVADRAGLQIGATPSEMLEHDLAYELDVARMLNEAIALARDRGDNGTRALLAQLLQDTEEDHIRWLEAQLHAIDEVGIERYLAEQLHADEGEAGA